jgi:hypothetical protein
MDYQRYRRQERRRRIAGALISWAFLIVSAAFLVFIGWCAIVGMVALFG